MEFELADSTEVLFKENLRSSSYRKSNFALVFATVFCVLLVIACIVLAVLYSQELNKSSPDVMYSRESNKSSTNASNETQPNCSQNVEKYEICDDEQCFRLCQVNSSTNATNEMQPNCSQNVEKYEICDDEQCFRLGQEMVKNMNKSVDPCEDFYAYACGGWQHRHPLKYNASEETTGDVVWHKNIHVLKDALEWAHVNYSKNDAVMKMVRVYKSCLNTPVIDALGLQPLKDLIKQYGGWSISQNYDPTVTVAQRIGRTARDLNIDSLFGMDVINNPYNSDVNVLMLKESALGLNKRDYLDPDNNSKRKRKEYKKYMKVVSQIFKVSYAKMEAIYDFEVKLAKILSGKSPDAAFMDYIRTIAMRNKARRDTEDGTIKLSELCKRTGFPWPVLKEVLDVLFDRELTGNEKFYPVTVHIAFLKAISPLYNKTNRALLADYIMWQVVRKYVGVLPDQYRPSKGDLLASAKGSRWWQCIEAMEKPFDMPLSLLYVDAHFNDDARVKIREMIESVRASFIQKLPTQTWMDKETQEMAKQKALAITIEDIGYPDYIKDPAKLKAQYDSLNVTDNLMENMKAANHFYRMRTLKKFQRPVDKKEWTFGIAFEDNSFYLSSMNRIIFLAGSLQKPMYSPDYPRYINYGSTGSVVGHEITHAFDGTGRLYDKNGNVKDWWSASSAVNFESKSKCFVKEYDKYKIFDKHANGTKTLDENIADNGGIKLAFDAYQRWTKENGTENILPGLDLNPNQLFFLRYAQEWCTVYSKDGAYDQLDTDEHSTGKYRVLGSLSNYKRFSEVFKCSPNSGMNPVDKCGIW